jgi:hypothetical protein
MTSPIALMDLEQRILMKKLELKEKARQQARTSKKNDQGVMESPSFKIKEPEDHRK